MATSDKASMRILYLTAQSFHPQARKASTHFLALGLRQLGHEVYVLTVGTSLLRLAMAPHRHKGVWAYRNWRQDADGLWKRVLMDAVHRPARDTGFVSRLFWRSGKLGKSVLRPIGPIDAVVIASGLAVSYYDFVRRTYPEARVLYNAADSLSGVGYSGPLLEAERKVLATADAVRTPSALLARQFPAGTSWFLIPHGVDKTVLLKDTPSPYPPGSINAVLAGSTLLDWNALLAIARAVPEATVHVFGVGDRPGGAANLAMHGEVGFDQLAPYIQHASCALAPYQLTAKNAYIAESSLKIRQYRVCGLPIVCPNTLEIEGDDVFQYDPANLSSVSRSIRAALRRGKRPFSKHLPTWNEVAIEMDGILAGRC